VVSKCSLAVVQKNNSGKYVKEKRKKEFKNVWIEDACHKRNNKKEFK